MAKVKEMDVDVIVTRASNPKGVSFALDAGKGRAQRIELKNEKHPGIMLYFNIVDDPQNPTGLTFKPTPSNALWVNSQDTTCPTTASVWNQFVPLSVEDPDNVGKNTQLIVYCRNKVIKEFAFTLWFLWPDGREVDYDPIGDGQNGLRK